VVGRWGRRGEGGAVVSPPELPAVGTPEREVGLDSLFLIYTMGTIWLL
jgi:hypothetical protein